MKKYLILVFAVPVFIFLLIGSAYADSAKDAVMALKKLQAKCQSGISYRDYSNALGDAKFPVNIFLESADAKKYPVLTTSILEAMKHYEYAGTLWNYKMSDRFTALIRCNSELAMQINKLYPQIKRDPGEFCYFVDALLPIIWNEASKELDNMTNLYSKIGDQSASEMDILRKENMDLKSQIDNLKKENIDSKSQMDKLKEENALLKKPQKKGR